MTSTSAFAWTPHRFAGGALALDVANSVILRHDPTQRRDRFADPVALAAFAPAASKLCGEQPGLGPLLPVAEAGRTGFLALREAIDGYFRLRVGGRDERDALADLLQHGALQLRQADDERALGAATARSALRLVASPEPERIKICGNCGWLFLDRSRNRSRFWCDMAVCGNRVKAGRHYRRRKGDRDDRNDKDDRENEGDRNAESSGSDGTVGGNGGDTR